jgi:2-hydroxychromene-2-carboxylate isomerase
VSRVQMHPPRWYVSIRSPYSWLALHDAAGTGSALLSGSEMRVFFEPGGEFARKVADVSIRSHYTPMSRAKHLYILRDVARLARQRRLVVTWPVDSNPRWEASAVALARALQDSQEEGKQLALALSNVRWLEGGDVHDEATIARCLSQVGLNPELAVLHKTEEGAEIGRGILRQLDRDGVFGVPFLVVGREPYWGLERLSLAEAANGTAPLSIVLPRGGSVTTGIDDQPGGCG